MAAHYDLSSTVIGESQFAVVLLSTHRDSGTKRAVKVIAKPALLAESEKGAAETKVRLAHEKEVLLLGLSHKHILRTHALYETHEALFLVMDYYAGGQLFQHIARRGAYTEDEARVVLRQLFAATASLHKHGIVHRDIKPENVLLRTDADVGPIALTDFALAQVVHDADTLFSACGSPLYVAPEMLLGSGYGRAVDVWSCGVVAYELLCGYAPFRGESTHDVFSRIIADRVEFDDAFWGDKSDAAKDFVRKCLCGKEERISAAEALSDPWLAGDTEAATPQARSSKKYPQLEHSKTEQYIDLNEITGTKYFIREKPRRRSRDGPSAETLNHMLRQYGSSEIPDRSRIDPSVPRGQEQGYTFGTLLRAIPALLNQTVAIGSTLANHMLYGPPKRSWGVEMSLITSTVREFATKNTSLATMSGLQKLFDLARFIPTSDDGLVTPVTYKVRCRNLRGFLADEDSKEDGRREQTGEWIVGRPVWRRLQSDWQHGKRDGCERVILYIHGGAYFLMSATVYRGLTNALSKYTECRVFCPNYRLAPDTQFPGALLDVVYAWLRLTDDLKIPANNIVVAADSAGGGLALALMLYLRDNKYPMPCGAVLFSPWVDLTLSCDSWETNAAFDYLPRPENGDHMNPIAAYLGDNMNKYLTHPYVSPLFGDMHGLPPLLIQCGDSEVLRDEDTLLAHKCSLARVPVRHEIYEDGVHVFQFFLFLDASRKALQSVRHFMRTALNRIPKQQPTLVARGTLDQLNSEIRQGHADAPEQQRQGGEPDTMANSDDDDDAADWDLMPR